MCYRRVITMRRYQIVTSSYNFRITRHIPGGDATRVTSLRMFVYFFIMRNISAEEDTALLLLIF
jgi:hypothetical protein